LGFGDLGLGIGPNPQSPIPNPQSPIPNLISRNLNYLFNKYNLLDNNLSKNKFKDLNKYKII